MHQQKGPAWRQAGFVHVLIMVLLLVGIGTGTYLVQNKTNFLPKAREFSTQVFRQEDFSLYPRPKFDTGIGIHWSIELHRKPDSLYSKATAEAAAPKLKTMGISWVKMLVNFDYQSKQAASDVVNFAKVMKDNDIEPIVRLHRNNPESIDPSKNSLTDLEWSPVDALIASGVTYFESKNEPNLSTEWQNNRMPEDIQTAVDLVMGSWVKEAVIFQKKGAIPLFPAMGNTADSGGEYGDRATFNSVDFEKRSFNWLKTHNCQLANGQNGKCSLIFDAAYSNNKPAALAVHNYSRRTDNQKDSNGKIKFFDSTKKDGSGNYLDIRGFLQFKVLHEISRQYFDKDIPILSTEGGMMFCSGNPSDMPAVDANWHQDVTVAVARYQMNNTDPYYFNTAFWMAFTTLKYDPNTRQGIDVSCPDLSGGRATAIMCSFGCGCNSGWFDRAAEGRLVSRFPLTTNALISLPKKSRNIQSPTPTPTPTSTPTPTPVPTGTPAKPPAPNITVTAPGKCISGSQTGNTIATVFWTNNSTPVKWVDISSSTAFTSWYHKAITVTTNNITSTALPAGFTGANGTVTGNLTIRPDTTYYVRFGNGTLGPMTSFTVPRCPTNSDTNNILR